MDFKLKMLVQPVRASQSAPVEAYGRERKNETIFKIYDN